MAKFRPPSTAVAANADSLGENGAEVMAQVGSSMEKAADGDVSKEGIQDCLFVLYGGYDSTASGSKEEGPTLSVKRIASGSHEEDGSRAKRQKANANEMAIENILRLIKGEAHEDDEADSDAEGWITALPKILQARIHSMRDARGNLNARAVRLKYHNWLAPALWDHRWDKAYDEACSDSAPGFEVELVWGRDSVGTSSQMLEMVVSTIEKIIMGVKSFYIGIATCPIKRCFGWNRFPDYPYPGHCERYLMMRVLSASSAQIKALMEIALILVFNVDDDDRCDNKGEGGEHAGPTGNLSFVYVCWNPC